MNMRPKGHVVKVNNFLFIFICTYDSAIISKTRANQLILELFLHSAAQET